MELWARLVAVQGVPFPYCNPNCLNSSHVTRPSSEVLKLKTQSSKSPNLVIGKKKAARQIVVTLISATFCGSPPALVGWMARSAATPEQPRRMHRRDPGLYLLSSNAAGKWFLFFLLVLGRGGWWLIWGKILNPLLQWTSGTPESPGLTVQGQRRVQKKESKN